MSNPQPLAERLLQTARSSASSFNLQYPHFSFRSSSSCLSLLPLLHVTSILPSITCTRRQFLRKMWPTQLAFLLFTVCRIFLFSLALCNTSSFPTRSVQLSFFILQQQHVSKLSRYLRFAFRNVQASAPNKDMPQMWHFTGFFLKFKSN